MSSEYSFITLIWFNITMFVYVDLDCSRKWKLPANVSNEKCLNNRKSFFLILSLLLFHVRYKKITEEMESVQEASASPSEIIISTIISFFITYAKEVIFTLFFFLPVSTSWFVGLSSGLHNNYSSEFQQMLMDIVLTLTLTLHFGADLDKGMTSFPLSLTSQSSHFCSFFNGWILNEKQNKTGIFKWLVSKSEYSLIHLAYSNVFYLIFG